MNRGAAFVVGGSGGLGHAICEALSREWEAIAVGYRSGRARAERLAARLPCPAMALRCDLEDAASIGASMETAAAHFGEIGTVVFTSGVDIKQPFVGDIAEAQWRQVIETELVGFTRVVGSALPLFRKQGHGNFVSVVSFATSSYPPGDALSAVPKAAIEMLGRALAKEEGRFGIRANMVAPGIIDAGLGAVFLKELYSPDIWETQRRRTALRRFGTGEDIAETVAFLASARARYITGQTIVVDGGLSL